jgi:hypothetical protein
MFKFVLCFICFKGHFTKGPLYELQAYYFSLMTKFDETWNTAFQSASLILAQFKGHLHKGQNEPINILIPLRDFAKTL